MPEPLSVPFLDKSEIAESTQEFHFEKPGSWTFEPGQHLELTLPRLLLPDDKGSSRSFSIASIPSDPMIAIATRIRPSGFKQTLASLQPGAIVQISGPYGSFVLHEDRTKPAVFLAGGIGITPFMSFLRETEYHPTGHRYILFYSNQTLGALSYHDQLQHLADEGVFTYLPTLTDDPRAVWPGHFGRIDQIWLESTVDQPSQAIWYLAGPPGFVVAMQNLLKNMGVSRDNVKSEDFSGYD